MSKIIEKVTAIKKDTVKSGRSVGKPYYRVTLGNGDTAFAWSFDAIRGVKVGEMAELIVESKGKFLNITNSVPVGSQAQEIPSDDDVDFEEEEDNDKATKVGWKDEEANPELKKDMVKGKNVFPYKDINKVESVASKDDYWQAKFEYDLTKDKNITRMSAMKSAIEYANYCKPTDTAKFKTLSEEDIIYIAEIFFNYFTTGKFVEAEE